MEGLWVHVITEITFVSVVIFV